MAVSIVPITFNVSWFLMKLIQSFLRFGQNLAIAKFNELFVWSLLIIGNISRFVRRRFILPYKKNIQVLILK